MAEEDSQDLGGLVRDILETPSPKTNRKIKAKGMLLGERRDNGEIIQIDKMVLARHAAMLRRLKADQGHLLQSLVRWTWRDPRGLSSIRQHRPSRWKVLLIH